MRTAQIIEMYQSLPAHLQQEVAHFLEFLIGKKEAQEGAGPEKPQMTLSIPENPDPTALFGLWEKQPLHLSELRKKAWQR